MPAAGAAVGRAPRPAPDWLHQLPAWNRRSIRPPLTKSSTLVVGPGPVGRAEPPHPLREVSINMPMFDGKPPRLTSPLRNATANDCSSTKLLKSIQCACRTEVPFTVLLMVKFGSVVGP